MAELRSTPSPLALSSLKGNTAPAVESQNSLCSDIFCPILIFQLDFDFCRLDVSSNSIICLYVSLPASMCQGSLAEAMGEMVRGEAPQLDGTRIPRVLTGAARPERSAAFSGATLLNWTLDRQPTKPGVLYRSIRMWSICPVSNITAEETVKGLSSFNIFSKLFDNKEIQGFLVTVSYKRFSYFKA